MARMVKTHRAAKTGRTAHFQLKLFWCRESLLPGREDLWREFYTRTVLFENELRLNRALHLNSICAFCAFLWRSVWHRSCGYVA